MRRLLLASVALLLALRVEPAASAGPDPKPTEWTLDVTEPSLVRIDVRRVPGMAAKSLAAWGEGDDGDQILVAASPPADAFAFVALPTGPGGRERFVLTAGISMEGGSADVIDDASIAVERFTLADDRVFGAVAAADPKVYDHPFPLWFLAKIEPTGSADFAVSLPAPGPADAATVTVKVAFAPTHAGDVKLQATWGPKDLGTATAVRGDVLSTATFTCAAKDAPPAGAALRVTDLTGALPPPDPQDVSDDRGAIWVDSVVVRSAMKAHAGPRVEATGGRVRLKVVDGTALLRLHVAPPSPVAAAKGADEVILATKALLPSATRLAAHRTKTGVKAVVVPIADVLDGATDARPIRAYFEALARDGHGPRFVLLCGDATYDRTDFIADETIPTMYARTQYNGATASDRLLVLPTLDAKVGGPAIGRLPFRDPKDMDAYVDRLIAYETHPPADATRRMLRFVTSEGRFGTAADAMIETLFRRILAEHIPPAYDVEVTFASVGSVFCWPPPHFNDKVIEGINEGALFETYVGHGWWNGFDALRVGNDRYPILRDRDVSRIAVRGTPPAMFVIACTTAEFDSPEHDSVGELLMKRPKGPIAYFGATRVCHPVWNSMVGRRLAMDMFSRKDARGGEIIQGAEDEVVVPTPGKDRDRAAIEMVAGTLLHVADLNPIYVEGSRMYALLGDPALKVALPAADLDVDAKPAGTGVAVTVTASGIPDGTEIRVSLEVPRNSELPVAPLETNEKDPNGYESMKKRHDAANEKALSRATARASGGKATITFEVPDAWRGKTLFAKAFAVYGDDAHLGSARFDVPEGK